MGNSEATAEIGVFGGSGFYSLKAEGAVQEVEVKTRYGNPSAPISIVEIAGRRVAFLPRHGLKHQFAPAAINYRANLTAFKELGVTRVIAPFACGSLQPNIKPGDFIVVDQFVNFTTGRKDSFYDAPPARVAHASAAEPYCPELRELAVKAAREDGTRVRDKGVVVVINGPRFSTRSESEMFSKYGWSVVNMTQYPEVILARELEMCYAGIGLVTDYDAGLARHPEIKPVEIEEVLHIFKSNNEKMKKILETLIKTIPRERGAKCGCATAMKNAFL
ncbi:S-methyl-5'-thioadenosine phosphorylase [Candidatus Micrarchaeota archaeon]|nr:S-methyl-5'-thioadenosine phosphorylase [Candidatus Micrarchaeota archaeon]